MMDLTYISVNSVRIAVKALNWKEACGPDCIYNEHLINGSSTLYKQLAIFFTDMHYENMPIQIYRK